MIVACVAGVPIPSVSRRSCLILGLETNLAIPIIAWSRVALVNRLGGFVFFSTVLVCVAVMRWPAARTGMTAEYVSALREIIFPLRDDLDAERSEGDGSPRSSRTVSGLSCNV